jgi:hypothetical protein
MAECDHVWGYYDYTAGIQFVPQDSLGKVCGICLIARQGGVATIGDGSSHGPTSAYCVGCFADEEVHNVELVQRGKRHFWMGKCPMGHKVMRVASTADAAAAIASGVLLGVAK